MHAVIDKQKKNHDMHFHLLLVLNKKLKKWRCRWLGKYYVYMNSLVKGGERKKKINKYKTKNITYICIV
jgi:hypothetical protein